VTGFAYNSVDILCFWAIPGSVESRENPGRIWQNSDL